AVRHVRVDGGVTLGGGLVNTVVEAVVQPGQYPQLGLHVAQHPEGVGLVVINAQQVSRVVVRIHVEVGVLAVIIVHGAGRVGHQCVYDQLTVGPCRVPVRDACFVDAAGGQVHFDGEPLVVKERLFGIEPGRGPFKAAFLHDPVLLQAGDGGQVVAGIGRFGK